MSNPIPEDKRLALAQLIFAGQKIEAIKLHREITGLGLADAKAAVEALEASLRQASPEKFAAPPKGKGCLGMAAAFCLASTLLIYWVLRS